MPVAISLPPVRTETQFRRPLRSDDSLRGETPEPPSSSPPSGSMRRLSSARSSSSAQTGQAGRRRHKHYPARQHQRTRRTPHQNRRLPGNCCDYADRASPNATSSTNTPRLSLRQAKRRSEAREDPARPNTGFTGRRAIRKRLRLPPSPPRILTSNRLPRRHRRRRRHHGHHGPLGPCWTAPICLTRSSTRLEAARGERNAITRNRLSPCES